MEGPREASILEQLRRLMPEGGRVRRLVGWGVVAWATIGLAIVAGLIGHVVVLVAGVLPYLVVAWLVVFVLNPPVVLLARRGVPRRLAAVLVFAGAVAVGTLFLVLVVPGVVQQTQALIRSSPGLLREGGGLLGRLRGSSNPLFAHVGDAAESFVAAHAGTAGKDLQTILSAGLQLAHAGLVAILGGFLGFLVLLSLPETARGALALIPPSRRERVEPVLAEIRRIVSGYVRARLIVSVAVGLLATVGLWAVHLQFWLVLGIFVGLANVIPMLGSWIGGIPVAMVSLATRPPSYLIVVLAVIVLAHTIDGYLLSPIVLRETVNLHPVVVLLVVLVGAEVLGFWGILASIPIAAVAQFALARFVVPLLTGGPRAQDVLERSPG